MKGNRISLTILLIICGLFAGSAFLYFVPQERIDTQFDGAVSVLDDLTVMYVLTFEARSYDQSIDILLSCYDATIDVFVLTRSEWGDWYNGDDYSAIFEALNTSYVSTTLQVTPPVTGYVYVIIQTNYGDAAYVGSIVGHALAYDEYGATILAILTIPFIVGMISYTYTKRRRIEDSTHSIRSTTASPE